jgi:DNA-binding NarL/FixJ family response regulator
MRVLLVDDHDIVRIGLRQLLAGQPEGFECLEADSLAQAQRQLEAQPEVALILLDLSLGEQFALPGIRSLRAAAPAARVLVLSSMSEALYAERALEAGADGYVMKSELGAQLLDAVRCVLAGRVYLSPSQRDAALRRRSEPAQGALSPREVEVLQLIGQGLSTREIAERLHRSVKTIETHKQTLKTKLGADSPAQLIRLALSWRGEAP